MSHLLDEILALADGEPSITATLSGESVAVLLFATGFLEDRFNWLDLKFDPMDEVTDSQWDIIEKLVANLYEEVVTPVTIIPVGTIQMYGGNTIPTGWIECKFQSLLRADHPALFTAIGTLYGAVDGTHFNLPDFRSRSPYGVNVSDTDMGQVQGATQHAITVNELPAHNHVQHIGNNVVERAAGAGTGGFTSDAIAAGTVNGQQITGNTGLGNLLSLLHPVTIVRFIIYAGL